MLGNIFSIEMIIWALYSYFGIHRLYYKATAMVEGLPNTVKFLDPRTTKKSLCSRKSLLLKTITNQNAAVEPSPSGYIYTSLPYRRPREHYRREDTKMVKV